MRKWRAALLSLALLLCYAAPAAADLPIPQPSPGDAGEHAASILAQSQFAPAKKSVIERFLSWLWDKIKVPFAAAAGGNQVVGYAILIAFVAVLVYVVSRLRLGLPSAGDSAPPGIDIAVDEHRSASAWREQAEAFEAAREWKEALRARYRWLIAELVERHQLLDIPGRTAGEYRRELQDARPQLGPHFAAATDLFELAWYGNEPTGEDENRRFRALAAAVLDAHAEVER